MHESWLCPATEVTDLKNVRKDVFLHSCVVYAHRTASDLYAVQHEVVMLAADLFVDSDISIDMLASAVM